MSERATFYAVLALIVAIGILLFSLPVKAQEVEVEMELEVFHGTTVREFHIQAPEATMMQCVFQAPIIASKFINENLVGVWVIRRMTCGPPRRKI